MRKKFFWTLFFFIIVSLFYRIKKAGSERINFVVINESIAVVSLDPGKNFILLNLPGNLYLEVPQGIGKYQLSSVYKLGELEGRGMELLEETLENYLGIPLDHYINFSGCRAVEGSDGARQIGKLTSCLIPLLWGRGETNFSKVGIIKLWWEIERLRADRIKNIRLKETEVLKKSSLLDGTEIFNTEFYRLDELIKRYFSNKRIEKEAIKIGILNATDQPGLANKLARLITNMGGEVVVVGNSDKKLEATSFKCQDKLVKKSYTVQKIEKILGLKAEIGEIGESRVDLLIVLGSDYSSARGKP